MSLKLLWKILITIFFIAFTALFFYLTINDKFDFIDRVEFIGLENISNSEITQAVEELELKNKNFWQIPSLKISRYLSKRPLVKKIVIKSNIIPKGHYKVYILEQNPWALYRNSIYDKDLKIIIDSDASAKLYNSEAVTKVYNDFQNKKPGLINISSYSILSKTELSTIKKIHSIVERFLPVIDKFDYSVVAEVDSESNLIIYSKQYRFYFGCIIDEDIIIRAMKLDDIVYQASKIKDKLSYIDLSLSTDEVILGQK
jgi:hypothetical protein